MRQGIAAVAGWDRMLFGEVVGRREDENRMIWTSLRDVENVIVVETLRAFG